MLAQNELRVFQIDRLAESYGIQKLLRRREILERMQNLICPCINSVCKKKVSPHNFLKKSKLFQNGTMHLNQ